MAKRFIDSSFFRKDFVKGLDAPYKLLWMYLISECDHAGLWDVEIEVAEIRLGVKFKGDPLKVLGEKVIPVADGTKWFIPSFVEFQYGTLKPENRAHASVICLLQKHNLLNEDYSIKPLTSPLQGAKDIDMVKETVRDTDKIKETKPLKKEKPSDLIPESWPVVEFESFWSEFLEVRAVKKRPLTHNAMKRAVAKLIKLSNGEWRQAEGIMIYSIDKSYDQFFLPRENNGTVKPPKYQTGVMEMKRDRA